MSLTKKRVVQAAIVLVLFVTTVYLNPLSSYSFSMSFNSENLQPKKPTTAVTVESINETNATSERTEKRILLWNSPNRIEASSFGTGRDAFVANRCAVDACRIVVNANEYPMESYDAIVINMHELWLTHLPRFERSAHQRLIFFTQESPQTMEAVNTADYDGYFNWTMSYKLNSDIQLLYGRIERRPDRTNRANATVSIVQKNRAVVWMASHCETNSRREDYVAELNRYISVDIFGGCGDGRFYCPRNDTHWISEPHCYDHIEQTYKFYLSFENSICNDYVTEKFFLLMQRRIVPVVYGGADYGRLAPPHSFINARDFTPQSLAIYLTLLDANQTLYDQYFAWKDQYNVEAGVEQMARHGFCDLCSKLHDDSPIKVYENLASHWSSYTQCITIKS